MRKRGWIAAGAAAAVVAAGTGAAVWWGAAHADKKEQRQSEVRTALVERTSLTAGLELRAVLAYGEPQELAGASGMVTKAPEAGSTHTAGSALLEIEGNPVFLLRGDVPLWRDLGVGMSGVDVDTLREGLVELGYAAGAPAATPFDSQLAAAIDALYADAGYAAPSSRPASQETQAETSQELATAQESLAQARQALTAVQQGPGSKDRTDAANAVAAAERALATAKKCTPSQRSENPEPGGLCDQVAAQEAVNSAKAGQADLLKTPDTTAEQAAVSAAQANLDAAQTKADRARLSGVGPKDVLIIPTEEIRVDQVKAKVGQSAEGAVVTWTDTTISAQADLTDAQQKLLVTGAEVTVTLPDGTVLPGVIGQVSAARQDQETWETIPARARIDIEDQGTLAANGISGVTVALIQDEAEDVLAVPVTALLALSEGGYAVELVDGTLVGVEVGVIQDTRVEIIPTTGDLEAGDEVVIA
jgi:hypothetical protein